MSFPSHPFLEVYALVERVTIKTNMYRLLQHCSSFRKQVTVGRGAKNQVQVHLCCFVTETATFSPKVEWKARSLKPFHSIYEVLLCAIQGQEDSHTKTISGPACLFRDVKMPHNITYSQPLFCCQLSSLCIDLLCKPVVLWTFRTLINKKKKKKP